MAWGVATAAYQVCVGVWRGMGAQMVCMGAWMADEMHRIPLSVYILNSNHWLVKIQIEGGWNEGGRTPSVWDTFSQAGGHTFLNETG